MWPDGATVSEIRRGVVDTFRLRVRESNLFPRVFKTSLFGGLETDSFRVPVDLLLWKKADVLGLHESGEGLGFIFQDPGRQPTTRAVAPAPMRTPAPVPAPEPPPEPVPAKPPFDPSKHLAMESLPVDPVYEALHKEDKPWCRVCGCTGPELNFTSKWGVWSVCSPCLRSREYFSAEWSMGHKEPRLSPMKNDKCFHCDEKGSLEMLLFWCYWCSRAFHTKCYPKAPFGGFVSRFLCTDNCVSLFEAHRAQSSYPDEEPRGSPYRREKPAPEPILTNTPASPVNEADPPRLRKRRVEENPISPNPSTRRAKKREPPKDPVEPLFVILSKKNIPWCRICGCTETFRWLSGPWGEKSVCFETDCQIKALSADFTVGEEDRTFPMSQEVCNKCYMEGTQPLHRCSGCSWAFHTSCHKNKPSVSRAFFCTRKCELAHSNAHNG